MTHRVDLPSAKELRDRLRTLSSIGTTSYGECNPVDLVRLSAACGVLCVTSSCASWATAVLACEGSMPPTYVTRKVLHDGLKALGRARKVQLSLLGKTLALTSSKETRQVYLASDILWRDPFKRLRKLQLLCRWDDVGELLDSIRFVIKLGTAVTDSTVALKKISGLLMQPDKVVATDGFRIHIAPFSGPPRSVRILREVLRVLNSTAGQGPLELWGSSDYTVLRYGDWELGCPPYEYLDYDTACPRLRRYAVQATVDAAVLAGCIRKIGSKAVELVVGPDYIAVEEVLIPGEVRKAEPPPPDDMARSAAIEGVPTRGRAKVRLNAQYLDEVLSLGASGEVDIYLVDQVDDDASTFVPVSILNDGQLRAVIMPMKRT